VCLLIEKNTNLNVGKTKKLATYYLKFSELVLKKKWKCEGLRVDTSRKLYLNFINIIETYANIDLVYCYKGFVSILKLNINYINTIIT
jgi:hypothetical protein